MDVTSTTEKRATAPMSASLRQRTKEFLRTLSAPLDGVQRIAGEEALGAPTYLVGDIKRKVASIFEMAISSTADCTDFQDHFLHLEILLEAAHDHRESSARIKDVLRGMAVHTALFYELLEIEGQGALRVEHDERRAA